MRWKMGKIKSIIKLFRVKHYLKNVLIFLPLFFSGEFLSINIVKAVLAFITFCLLSSAIYILNDICDYKNDRQHPTKSERPIANGTVSKKEAFIIMFACFIAGVILCIFTSRRIITFVYPLLYVLINILYSIKLKNVPIVDIALLTSGFFIRVLYGGAVVDVPVSSWLYLTITAIAFYMVLGKRKKELDKNPEGNTRQVLKAYTSEFLDKFMYVCMTLAIVFYSLWAKNLENSVMIWTVPLVILIAMKYSLDINKPESDGDPIEVILSDIPIILMLAVYAVTAVLVIYLPIIYR